MSCAVEIVELVSVHVTSLYEEFFATLKTKILNFRDCLHFRVYFLNAIKKNALKNPTAVRRRLGIDSCRTVERYVLYK